MENVCLRLACGVFNKGTANLFLCHLSWLRNIDLGISEKTAD